MRSHARPLRHRAPSALVVATGIAATALTGCSSPPTVAEYVDEAIDIAARGIEADPATVETVRARVHEETRDATEYADTYDALKVAVTQIAGDHSGFLTPEEKEAVFGDTDPADPTVPSMTHGGRVTTIEIPEFLGSNDEGYTRAAVDGWAAVPADTCGYVVDLRGNGGGNMGPMMAAVSPLLTEGTVLSFVYPGDTRVGVEVTGNAVSVNGYAMGELPETVPHRVAPVAVLVDGGTASSAEATAIAFVGQENATTIGQTTYGFATANEPTDLPDGAAINLTTAREADRNGTVHSPGVVPEHVVEGGAEQEGAARTWVAERCGG